MKLQGVTIIFCLIVIPVILVLSSYIQLQVDTIALQTSYDTKLLDATRDAMSAFEINTANESLSSVADSLRGIITASNNIFINALATNFGMSNASQSMIQPYIPAVLYTLYDGYYIYSPTKIPEVLKNSKGVAVVVGDVGTKVIDNSSHPYTIYGYDAPTLTNDAGIYVDEHGDPLESDLELSRNEEDYGQILYKLDETIAGPDAYTTVVQEGITRYKTDFVLKSFMPYSARYKTDKKDFVINYTLDNYIIVNGTIEEIIGGETRKIYYSKSGYLIDKNLLVKESETEPNITINGNRDLGLQLLSYNEEKVEERIDEEAGEIRLYLNTSYENTERNIYLSSSIPKEKEAIKYYIKSYIFSKWVYDNLGDIEEKDISKIAIENQTSLYKDIQNTEYNVIYNFETSDKKIFNSSENPEKIDSSFSNHKTAIIKNSIQYNLNVAMSAYNQMTAQAFSFNMPLISDEEWNIVASNVSIVSFMQGFKCGLKMFNNYCIVPSTNNELTVIPNEIYYVTSPTATSSDDLILDQDSTYHRIDCPDFNYPEVDTSDTSSAQIYNFFKSKEAKYDKYYDKGSQRYIYNHKNFACYKCIVNGNYKKAYFNGTETVPAENGKYTNELEIENLTPQKQRLYYTAVGYERQNIYKSNAIQKSQGLEVIDENNGLAENYGTFNINGMQGSTRNISEIKEIKLILSDIKAAAEGTNSVPIAIFNIELKGGAGFSYNVPTSYTLNKQTKEQTISFEFDVNAPGVNKTAAENSKLTSVVIKKTGPNEENVQFVLKEIQILYK